MRVLALPPAGPKARPGVVEEVPLMVDPREAVVGAGRQWTASEAVGAVGALGAPRLLWW